MKKQTKVEKNSKTESKVSLPSWMLPDYTYAFRMLMENNGLMKKQGDVEKIRFKALIRHDNKVYDVASMVWSGGRLSFVTLSKDGFMVTEDVDGIVEDKFFAVEDVELMRCTDEVTTDRITDGDIRAAVERRDDVGFHELKKIWNDVGKLLIRLRCAFPGCEISFQSLTTEWYYDNICRVLVKYNLTENQKRNYMLALVHLEAWNHGYNK